MEFKQFVMPTGAAEDEAEGNSQRIEVALTPQSTSSAPCHGQASPEAPMAPDSRTITFADDLDVEMEPMLGPPSTADSTAPSAASVAGASKDDDGRLVHEEGRATGNVGYQLYMKYFKSWGPYFVLPAVLCSAQLCNNALGVCSLLDSSCAVLAADWLPRWQIRDLCGISVRPTAHASIEFDPGVTGHWLTVRNMMHNVV